MKTIKIKSLKLTNFKGIRKLELNDLSQETSIFGNNGTGKTTVFDAFTWLLFGKDSAGRTDFEIKTLDKFNNVIEKIDHSVEAIIMVDGEDAKFKRTFREKWVKKRGALEAEFSGNETLYEWNDVEMTKRDYEAKINEIIDESLFKLITNPKAFNDLKWQDQREVLIGLTGGLTNEEIAGDNPDFLNLIAKIESKTLAELTAQMKSSIRKSKDEIKFIPSRIDEVQNSKPIPMEYGKVKARIKENETKIEALNGQLTDTLKAHEVELKKQSDIRIAIQEKQHQIRLIYAEISQESQQTFNTQSTGSNTAKAKIQTIKGELESYTDGLRRLENQKKNLETIIQTAQKDMDAQRELWYAENAKEFNMDADSTKCPTCQREFDSDKIEELTAEAKKHFEDHKRHAIQRITDKGTSLKAEKEQTEQDLKKLVNRIDEGSKTISGLQTEIDQLQKKVNDAPEVSLAEIKAALENNRMKEITTFRDEIEALMKNLEEGATVDTSHLKEQQRDIQLAIDADKAILEEEKQIQRANERIEELTKEESELAQTIATYERELHVIERFTKAKIDALESSINSHFSYVSFKLFEIQVNGAEVETCKALVNGVPYNDVNTASKINAGLDIINTLCMHYNAIAPIFIDNRESVIQLIHTDSQIINLIVSEKDKKLRVESGVMAETV